MRKNGLEVITGALRGIPVRDDLQKSGGLDECGGSGEMHMEDAGCNWAEEETEERERDSFV